MLKDAQKEVHDWIRQHRVGYWKPLEQFTRLTEEVGELARELNHHYGPKKKKAGEDNKDLADELADVLFTLICLANSLEVDLDEAFKHTLDKCYGRDKDRFK